MRTWILMAAIVLAILSLDLTASRQIERSAGLLSAEASALTQAVEQRKWDRAASLQEELSSDWDDARGSLQKYLDHAELESVDIVMARIKAMLPLKDAVALLPELSELVRDITHLTERYELAIENVI